MKNKFYEIKNVFPVDELCNRQRVFDNTSSEVLNSTLNMERCIHVIKGEKTQAFKKFVSLVRKNDCDSEEFQVITSFYNHTQLQVEGLKSGLSHSSNSYHNVLISEIHPFHVVPKVPVDMWDLKYQVTCHNAFDLFTRSDLAHLKSILISMENFPWETYLLLYPLIGSILGIKVFSCCFSYIWEGNFFETIFKKTIDRVENVPLSFKDFTHYRPSRLTLVISGVVSSITIYGLIIHNKLFDSRISMPDLLKPYRFTGNTGVAIRIFKDNTGALLYTGLKIWNTYKKIIILSMLEPLLHLIEKFKLVKFN